MSPKAPEPIFSTVCTSSHSTASGSRISPDWPATRPSSPLGRRPHPAGASTRGVAAPAARSISSTLAKPLRRASSAGVWPQRSVTDTGAPALISTATAASCPSEHARCSAVRWS